MTRPLGVTVLSLLLIVVGIVQLFREVFHVQPLSFGLVALAIMQLTTITAGVFLFLGKNWARWLTIFWVGLHVILGAYHGIRGVVVHIILFVLIAALLFREPVSSYFKANSSTPSRA